MGKEKFATIAVHAGQHPDPETGAVSVPIFASSTFVFKNVEQGAARFEGKESGYIYSRLRNPTVRALEESLAELEGGEDARAMASGMAAITNSTMAVVKAGDDILANDAMVDSVTRPCSLDTDSTGDGPATRILTPATGHPSARFRVCTMSCSRDVRTLD